MFHFSAYDISELWQRRVGRGEEEVTSNRGQLLHMSRHLCFRAEHTERKCSVQYKVLVVDSPEWGLGKPGEQQGRGLWAVYGPPPWPQKSRMASGYIAQPCIVRFIHLPGQAVNTTDKICL